MIAVGHNSLSQLDVTDGHAALNATSSSSDSDEVLIARLLVSIGVGRQSGRHSQRIRMTKDGGNDGGVDADRPIVGAVKSVEIDVATGGIMHCDQ